MLNDARERLSLTRKLFRETYGFVVTGQVTLCCGPQCLTRQHSAVAKSMGLGSEVRAQGPGLPFSSSCDLGRVLTWLSLSFLYCKVGLFGG